MVFVSSLLLLLWLFLEWLLRKSCNRFSNSLVRSRKPSVILSIAINVFRVMSERVSEHVSAFSNDFGVWPQTVSMKLKTNGKASAKLKSKYITPLASWLVCLCLWRRRGKTNSSPATPWQQVEPAVCSCRAAGSRRQCNIKNNSTLLCTRHTHTHTHK